MTLRPPAPRTVALTAAAMAAFAGNSLLCRAALASRAIDPASFTSARLLSGAVVLALLVRLAGRERPSGGSAPWVAGGLLFLYAAAFSLAYLTLSAGAGALLLFGAVQTTMIAAGLIAGERPPAATWAGFAAAVAGLVYLVSPGIEAPHPGGSLLMAAAGVAWGLYSLRGFGGADPLAATAAAFVRSLPFAAALSLLLLPGFETSLRGLGLAVLSGAVASGLGYVVWYAALRGLTAITAALVQLSVPVVAAAAAVPLLGEPVTRRLAVSAVAVLGGIALALAGRRARAGS